MEFLINCWTNYTDRRKPNFFNKSLCQHQFVHHIQHEWARPVFVHQNLIYIQNHLIKPTLHALEYKHNRYTKNPHTRFGIPWVPFSIAITN